MEFLKRNGPHKCNICEKYFSTKQHLTGHIAAVHESIKPHKCNICGKHLSTKHHMIKHIEVVHKGIKPHKCVQCDASFARMLHYYDDTFANISNPVILFFFTVGIQKICKWRRRYFKGITFPWLYISRFDSSTGWQIDHTMWWMLGTLGKK